jgi:hypothetical protein
VEEEIDLILLRLSVDDVVLKEIRGFSGYGDGSSKHGDAA